MMRTVYTIKKNGILPFVYSQDLPTGAHVLFFHMDLPSSSTKQSIPKIIMYFKGLCNYENENQVMSHLEINKIGI